MTVGALLHLGLPLEKLERELKKMQGLRYRLEVSKKLVNGIKATRFRVRTKKEGGGRSWKKIRELIKQSSLGSEVKERGIDIFARLAKAEGRIHGVSPERVHFHEV
ncbi:MAG: nickel insertion protein, partial [Candidatus Binatia bacterium]